MSTSDKMLQGCIDLLANAYNEGFQDGHRKGLNCGNACHYPSELYEGWHSSCAKEAVQRIKEALEPKYCDDCTYLSPKEGDQGADKAMHGHEHPRLPRPEGCTHYRKEESAS